MVRPGLAASSSVLIALKLSVREEAAKTARFPWPAGKAIDSGLAADEGWAVAAGEAAAVGVTKPLQSMGVAWARGMPIRPGATATPISRAMRTSGRRRANLIRRDT